MKSEDIRFNFVIFCVNKKVIIVVENLGTF